MKYISPLFGILIVIIACQPKTTDNTEDLEGLKKLLSTKKGEITLLQEEINEISDKIAELDPSLQEKAKLVDTMHLAMEDFDRYIEIQGSVVSDDVANATSEVPGRITQLLIREGDYVSKGQLIATLDLESIDKTIAEVETSLSLAKDAFERQERLWNQNIGSEMQYLQAKNQVEQLEKSLETLAFQKTKANIYAPISGAIDQRMMEQGEVASPGMPIVRILNTSNLKIETDLPERYLKIAKRGVLVDMEIPSLEQNMRGRISLLGRTIDPSNRTLTLEIKPLGSTRALKPNLLALIKLKELTKEDVITVPLTTVMQEVDGKEYLFVASKDKQNDWRARKQYVTTDVATDNLIVIAEGIASGDILITTGSRTLSDGELLNLNTTSGE